VDTRVILFRTPRRGKSLDLVPSRLWLGLISFPFFSERLADGRFFPSAMYTAVFPPGFFGVKMRADTRFPPIKEGKRYLFPPRDETFPFTFFAKKISLFLRFLESGRSLAGHSLDFSSARNFFSSGVYLTAVFCAEWQRETSTLFSCGVVQQGFPSLAGGGPPPVKDCRASPLLRSFGDCIKDRWSSFFH